MAHDSLVVDVVPGLAISVFGGNSERPGEHTVLPKSFRVVEQRVERRLSTSIQRRRPGLCVAPRQESPSQIQGQDA